MFFVWLLDVKFFWENDVCVVKIGVSEWFEKFIYVIFYNKFGSQGEWIDCIVVFVCEIVLIVGVDVDLVEKVVCWVKVDLSFEMVYEFLEL